MPLNNIFRATRLTGSRWLETLLSNDAFRVLLSTGTGRLGLLFFMLLVGVSLYVVVAYPLDFGLKQWNNPLVWADNPKSVPPVWYRFIDKSKQPAHQVFSASTPYSVQVAGTAETRLYTFKADYDSEGIPTFLSFSLSDVHYQEAPPVVTVRLLRPDGRQVTLLRQVVRGPRPGETPPYSRYVDSPLRINLSGNDTTLSGTSDFLRREFGIDTAPRDLVANVEEALFGVPEGLDPTGFEALPGEYTVEVSAVVRDSRDSIGNVKVVLGGGSYGLMGTDSLGRDLIKGLLFGFPVALLIGLTTAVTTTVIGTFMGILSGFTGGKTDMVIQRSSDILVNIPLLPILIFLIFILGQKLWLVVAILVVFGWPGLAIVVRSMVLQVRAGQLVEATRALGASRWRIMFRHIFFQIAPYVFAQMIFLVPGAILLEAGLSFLGLGDPSIPTWGQILESGLRTGAVYVGFWWWVLPPGLLVVGTAMTFMLLTMGLEPVLNPRLRRTV